MWKPIRWSTQTVTRVGNIDASASICYKDKGKQYLIVAVPEGELNALQFRGEKMHDFQTPNIRRPNQTPLSQQIDTASSSLPLTGPVE